MQGTSNTVLIGLLMLVLMCGGCSRKPARTPLVVYSPHGKEMLQEFERRFEKLHRDIDVQWLDMGSQDVYDRVRTERQNPQADIWWGGPMTVFNRAEEEGLLEHYTPSWDSVASAGMKSPGGFWYGTFVTPEVIVFNTRLVRSDQAPKDWDDLLSPSWRGDILIRSPLASGTMRIIFCSIIERERSRTGNDTAGFDWLRRLDANTTSYVADPSQLYVRLARGEAPLSIWNLPDIAMQASRAGYPFGYVVPSSGSPLITDGIAVVKGARHPEAAKLFYEFVTSRHSMIVQANGFFRIPSRRDIPADSLPQWQRTIALVPMNVDWRSVAAHEQSWMRRWDEEVKGRGNQEIRNH
jgi:iron(III) transport system substrate-binding protein